MPSHKTERNRLVLWDAAWQTEPDFLVTPNGHQINTAAAIAGCSRTARCGANEAPSLEFATLAAVGTDACPTTDQRLSPSQ